MMKIFRIPRASINVTLRFEKNEEKAGWKPRIEWKEVSLLIWKAFGIYFENGYDRYGKNREEGRIWNKVAVKIKEL